MFKLFKCGETLVCVNSCLVTLTAGKEYVCVGVTKGGLVCVVNDDNATAWYHILYFKKKEETKPAEPEAFLIQCHDKDVFEVVDHGQKEKMEHRARKLLLEHPDRIYKITSVETTMSANVVIDIKRGE